jgi:signal transduction histidine kinase
MPDREPLLRVLLVDDDEDEFFLTRRLLRDAGPERFELEWADSYEAGIRQVRHRRHDVYLVDFRLGARTGVELVEEARAAGCQAPMIIVTVDTTPGHDRAALRTGADEFLVKGGLDTATLVEAIERTRDRRLKDVELQNTMRRDSLAVLAGGMAHHFNTLLGVVLLHAEELAHHLADDPTGRELLAPIADAAERGVALSKAMVGFAGVGPSRVTTTDLSRLVAGIEDLLRSALPPTARLELDVAEPGPTVLADEAQLRQAVLNLVVNAGEALPDGAGVVTVRTSVRHVTPSGAAALVLEGRTLEPGDYAALEVVDTGVGLDPEVRTRVFEPFFTTKMPGRGLGLATTAGIAQTHGGGVAVNSEPERGAVFTLLLPLRPASSTPA